MFRDKVNKKTRKRKRKLERAMTVVKVIKLVAFMSADLASIVLFY